MSNLRNIIFTAAICVCSILFFSAYISAQKIAVITPENSAQDVKFSNEISLKLSENFKVVDSSLSETVFKSENFENPFNLSLEESKNVGAAIGCNFFLLLKSSATRRESLNKNAYYESFAVIYLVSTRTGRLVFWKLQNFETDNSAASNKLLYHSINDLSMQIDKQIKLFAGSELNEKPPLTIEEVPDENSPDAKNLRPPLPFRRIKPVYTPAAFLYSIRATVDVTVDIDANGAVLQTEITRWAGFGLDESVIETVRRMNWRPADRNGKPLPMRVLLRYNFKKGSSD